VELWIIIMEQYNYQYQSLAEPQLSQAIASEADQRFKLNPESKKYLCHLLGFDEYWIGGCRTTSAKVRLPRSATIRSLSPEMSHSL
jgi:hypothetical protein